MSSLNRVILCGHLGAAPELRTTAGGRQLCKLRLATDRHTKTEEGWTQVTDWHRITLWENEAERAARLLMKGSLVAVEGRLHTESWTDKEGGRRSKLVVIGQRFQHLAKPRNSNTSAAAPARSPERTHPAFAAEAEDTAASIPF